MSSGYTDTMTALLRIETKINLLKMSVWTCILAKLYIYIYDYICMHIYIYAHTPEFRDGGTLFNGWAQGKFLGVCVRACVRDSESE